MLETAWPDGCEHLKLALWGQLEYAALRITQMRGAANHSGLVALEVQDVEREYARLKGLQLEWVQEKDRAVMEQIEGKRAMAILGAYARLLRTLRAWG